MKQVRWTPDGWFVKVGETEQRLSEDQVSFLKAAVAAAKAAKQIVEVRPAEGVEFEADPQELSRRLRWDTARVLRVTGELASLGLIEKPREVLS